MQSTNRGGGGTPLWVFAAILMVAMQGFADRCVAQDTTDTGGAAPAMKIYDEPGYYTIHSEVNIDVTREAYIRMNKIAAEYDRRLTAIFGGHVSKKLPFYLFSNDPDYQAMGGIPGSAGVFRFDWKGARLMAVVGDQITPWSWHVIQHEGFHQFVNALIGWNIPPWVNEGMAEFFGEGVFTGDGFVTGCLPAGRADRIKKEIRDGDFMPLGDMRRFSQQQWNSRLTILNYDEAVSMIFFLAFADHGKYATPFVSYLRAVHNGVDPDKAWVQIFGNNDQAFQDAWSKYWVNRPETESNELYTQAETAKFTSFLARAWVRGQTFKTVDEFFEAAGAGTLKQPQLTDPDWLPPAMLTRAIADKAMYGTWSLVAPHGTSDPRVICTMPDGTKMIGRFEENSNHCYTVTVVTPGDSDNQ